jgi:hypothetical protein
MRHQNGSRGTRTLPAERRASPSRSASARRRWLGGRGTRAFKMRGSAAALLALAAAPVAALAQNYNGFSTPSAQPSLTNNPELVSQKKGSLQWYACDNPNGSAAWIQVFDASATTGITPGTTPPKFFLPVPAGAYSAVVPANVLNGIVIAATTTPTGGTAPSTALSCSIGFT